MAELTGRLAAWVVEVVYTLGYVGLALLVALETIFPPIPSELILPLAGFLAGQGRFSYLGAVIASTVGSVIGALFFYALAWKVGDARLRRFVRRFGRWLLVDEEDLDKARAWFDRHRALAVFVGRLVPAVRSYVSIPAGLARMPVVPFVLLTLAGSGVWNAILIGAGWWLGERWDQVGGYLSQASQVVLIALGAAILWFVSKRVMRLRAT